MNDLNLPKPGKAYTNRIPKCREPIPANTPAMVTDSVLTRLDKIIELLEAHQQVPPYGLTDTTNPEDYPSIQSPDNKPISNVATPPDFGALSKRQSNNIVYQGSFTKKRDRNLVGPTDE